MEDTVTIGVPVYRGERYLEETLHSIQRQTHKAIDVIMSVDSPDPVCEAICAKFLDDPRFRLVVQPQRLGWVGQINWLIEQVTGDYWCYYQQDDIADESYLAVLVEHARAHPSAALVYCDLVPFGRISGEVFVAPPVLGTSPYGRVMTMLQEHFPAFAFRGLTRASALDTAGPVPTNAVDNFGVDIAWLTGVARAGELHRVPSPLYRKRYHDTNTESRWWKLSSRKRLQAWAHHCVDMLGQAIQVGGSPEQGRLLWLASIARLTAPEPANHFLDAASLTLKDRKFLLDAFVDQAASSYPEQIPLLLDAEWKEICALSDAAFWRPRAGLVEIVAFGPAPVPRGMPFNVQPDGQSAIWVKTSRLPPPRTSIKLGNHVLETVTSANVFTAPVPASLTAKAGQIPLILVGPDGKARSQPVVLTVSER